MKKNQYDSCVQSLEDETGRMNRALMAIKAVVVENSHDKELMHRVRIIFDAIKPYHERLVTHRSNMEDERIQNMIDLFFKDIGVMHE